MHGHVIVKESVQVPILFLTIYFLNYPKYLCRITRVEYVQKNSSNMLGYL